MRIQHSIAVFFFSFSLFFDAQARIYSGPERAYHQALDQVNEQLSQIQSEKTCPGLGLALSCGNNRCEPEQGENDENCPIDCDPSGVKSYNAQTICKEVKQISFPKNIQEVQEAVSSAVKVGHSIKVIGHTHTVNHFICTDGDVIDTRNLNKIIGIETFNGVETVKVEPGVTFNDLSQWLHSQNRSLGFTVIGFRDVTIGGALATGAHGSSTRHPVIASDRVESFTLVTADGQVKEFSKNTPDEETYKALRVNLGLLGVVVQIRLKIEPQFNLHLKVKYARDSDLFCKWGTLSRMKQCDYGHIHWFPQSRRLIETCAMKTHEIETPGAEDIWLNPQIPNLLVKPYKTALQLGACFQPLNALLENLRYATLQFIPPYVKNDPSGKIIHTTEVIGPSHQVISSSIGTEGKHASQMDWEFAIPESEIQAALKTIQNAISKNQLHFPLNGVFIRFAPSEDASLLSHVTAQGPFKAGEATAIIEFTVYRPKDFPSKLEKIYFQPFRDLVVKLMQVHHARAHWGKNEDWIFKFESDLGLYGNRLDRFSQIVHQLDPKGVFSNSLSRSIGF